jgi:hypothetical protein
MALVSWDIRNGQCAGDSVVESLNIVHVFREFSVECEHTLSTRSEYQLRPAAMSYEQYQNHRI